MHESCHDRSLTMVDWVVGQLEPSGDAMRTTSHSM